MHDISVGPLISLRFLIVRRIEDAFYAFYKNDVYLKAFFTMSLSGVFTVN